MAEKLLPLKLPPGLRATGTTYQAKDRWNAANFVRFFQDTIQPIGGWAKRTLTGSAITGTVSAAHSWTDSAGLVWIAIGTTTGVFVVKNSTNVAYNITPATFASPTATALWSFDNYGGWLVMSAISNDLTAGVAGLGYPSVWKCDTANVATQCDIAYSNTGVLAGSAYSIGGVVTTPERFFMCIRGIPYPTYTTVPTYYANS
jgi:hypothetical protein